MRYIHLSLALILVSVLFFWSTPASAQVTLLIPAKPDITVLTKAKKEVKPKERQTKPTPKGTPEKKGEKLPETKDSAKPATPSANGTVATSPKKVDELAKPVIDEETDVLITMMEPFAHKGLAMDRPQSFTVLYFNQGQPKKDGHLVPERLDLLGDVEEILYLGQRAWGANVGIDHPGLYQFLMETKPWWNEREQKFVQHLVKVMMPVLGQAAGWDEAAGLSLEIVPQTRPFGLLAPTLFTGKVLANGQPLADHLVYLGRINTDGQKVPTSWHETSVAKTNHEGLFSFAINKAGWWYCLAPIAGAPLKGADGQPKELELATIFWFYADNISGTTDRKSY